MKHKTTFFAAVILFSMLAFSCGNEKKTEEQIKVSPQEKLDGVWKIVNATGEFAEINKGTVYTFEGTQKLTTKLGIIESKGAIKTMSDTSFSVLFEGMQNNSNYSYHFENEKLIIEPQNSGQVFTLEKQ